MLLKKNLLTAAASVLTACLLLSSPAHADEAQIRKNIAERFTKFPPIDEVTKSPIPGLYEIRLGSDIIYADEEANHIFLEAQLIEARTRTNLTEARLNILGAIDFQKLPFKDAVVWKNGNGKRRLVVFSDPNCGYCKRLEADLQKLKDITIHTFIIPVLGADSVAKSKNIWCAKDKTATWLDWMLKGQTPPQAQASCDTSAIERNSALARKHRVKGTPAIVFTDNSRVPGALEAEDIEQRLSAIPKS
jgi:thiol:disulfide interchange protein DsbC